MYKEFITYRRENPGPYGQRAHFAWAMNGGKDRPGFQARGRHGRGRSRGQRENFLYTSTLCEIMGFPLLELYKPRDFIRFLCLFFCK